jgi:carbonic anhydrase/acetyltransferase-like protein (isoleucine patch superfamily)
MGLLLKGMLTLLSIDARRWPEPHQTKRLHVLTTRHHLDKRPRVGNKVYIDPAALVIGDVTLADDASVWPMAVVRGDVQRIEIGVASNVQDGCVLHVTHDGRFSPRGHPLIIGDGVTLGHRAVLHGCTIGDSCLIGIGAIVMDGAVLEEDVILGAGSLVPPGKHLETGHLYVGSPARRVRLLTEAEKAFLSYSAQHYVHLKNTYIKAVEASGGV